MIYHRGPIFTWPISSKAIFQLVCPTHASCGSNAWDEVCKQYSTKHFDCTNLLSRFCNNSGWLLGNGLSECGNWVPLSPSAPKLGSYNDKFVIWSFLFFKFSFSILARLPLGQTFDHIPQSHLTSYLAWRLSKTMENTQFMTGPCSTTKGPDSTAHNLLVG